MNDAPGTEEQTGLEESMGHQVKHRRTVGRDPGGEKHIPELAHGGIGQHPFDIVLSNRNGCRKQCGRRANDSNHFQGYRRHGKQEVQAGDHVHPRSDHRGGMDQCTDRCRALHGVREPHVKGDLGGLSRGANKQKQGCEGHDSHAPDLFVLYQRGILLNLAKHDGAMSHIVQ